MSYYQQNIELLREKRPGFYELYEKCISSRERAYPCEEIISGEAKDGNNIFQVRRDGQTVRLNSPYRPLQEAERWAAQFSGENIKVNAVMFGIGNGIFPRELLRKLRQDAKLFLVEPCVDIFRLAMEQQDMRDIIADERILFCFEDINPDGFFDLFRKNTHWTNLETQIICHHTGYEILFQEAYRDFLRSVQKASQTAQVNKDTQAYFSKKVVPNMIENLIYLKEGRIITDYVNKFPRDIPAIIVAAGPSLDKNIEELKRAQGKAFILAVDTAMRHLIKHEIMPDAMITLDVGKPFRYMNDPILKDIPLFCIFESNHEIMEFHQGIKIWFQGGPFQKGLFSMFDKNFVAYNAGGSVATAAFSVCAALEFERIVLVGQDLAYQGDITHAGGAISHVLNEKRGVKMIEGIDGNPVKSRHDWIIYLDWFEEAIAFIKDQTEVIDATEGGAMIHGSKIMTLVDVIDDYCKHEVDCASILQGQAPVFTEEEYALVVEEIKKYSPELSEMERMAEQAAKDCKKALHLLEKDPQNIKLDRMQKRVLETTSQISEYEIYELVDIYMSQIANQYLSGVFVVSDDSHQDEVNMYRSSQMIFQGIAETARELRPMLEKLTEQL